MTSRPKGNPPPSAPAIRAALKAKDLKIKDLAGMLGYVYDDGRPSSYLYNLLSGTQPLSRRQLHAIAQALHLDGDDLFFAEGMIPLDIEDRLISDRAFLAAVRQLAGE
jgi:transcriptional regulator with XRE-family HTH domain